MQRRENIIHFADGRRPSPRHSTCSQSAGLSSNSPGCGLLCFWRLIYDENEINSDKLHCQAGTSCTYFLLERLDAPAGMCNRNALASITRSRVLYFGCVRSHDCRSRDDRWMGLVHTDGLVDPEAPRPARTVNRIKTNSMGRCPRAGESCPFPAGSAPSKAEVSPFNGSILSFQDKIAKFNIDAVCCTGCHFAHYLAQEHSNRQSVGQVRFIAEPRSFGKGHSCRPTIHPADFWLDE